MLNDLLYKNPERSTLGDYKHSGGAFKYRREHLKNMGETIAKSGLMKQRPVDHAAVMKLLRPLGVFNVSGKMQFAFVESLLGKPVAEALRRDLRRYQDNHWQDVPWGEEPWYKTSGYYWLHSAHLPKEDKNAGQVAFAENTPKLVQDRFTVMKPGRYLQRYFSDVLDEGQIKLWAERYAAQFAPAELKFIEGDDPDGWVRVYRDGPQSCMKGSEAVQVYAHDKSVLRLAYMAKNNVITSRAIVREDTTPKQYVRVYPTNDCIEQTQLREALEAQGYVHGSLKGVLLDAIESDEASDAWVCPYLDSGRDGQTNVELVYQDGKSYLRVGRNGMDGQTQEGYVTDANMVTCDDCNDRVHEDDSHYIESSERYVCNSCCDDHYVAAMGRRYEELVHVDDAVYCETDGQHYREDYADRHDVYQCAVSDNWYKIDDLASTSRGYVYVDLTVNLDVEDSDGNSCAHMDDVVETHDGRVIHKDDAVLRTVYFHKDDEIENDQTPNDATNTQAA